MELGKWIVKFRWPIILTTLIFVAWAGSGMRFLKFTTDYRVFFSPDNPHLKAFEALQNKYSKSDNIFIGIESKDGNIFSQKPLKAIADLTEWSWQTPFSLRVDSLTNYQHTHAEEDELIVESLAPHPEKLNSAELKDIRNIALSEPTLVNRLVSSNGEMAGINITLNVPDDKLDQVPHIAEYVREIAERTRSKYPEVNVYVSGVVMMNNTFVSAVKGDMKTLIPLMYLTVILFLVITLRSGTGTVATLTIVFFADMTALGLAGWLGINLTTVSSFSPTVILTIAVADNVHILTTIFQQREQGKSKLDSIYESVRLNLQPVFLTSLTTAIGFLSLNFCDSPPYRDLGNIIAMGVAAAFFYSLFFLPAIVSFAPLNRKLKAKDHSPFMERFGKFVVRNQTILFWTVLVVGVAVSFPIYKIKVDDNFNEYFDKRFPFRTDSDYLADNLTGFMFIDYSLESGESGGIANPDFLKSVEKFTNWYRSQPEVIYVSSLTDTIKRLNKNMHNDYSGYYKLPESRELGAQFLLLYEMSLPFGLDLNNQINIDKSSTRLFAVLKSISSKELLEVDNRARSWLKKNTGIETIGASPLVMFAHIALRNIQSMIGGTGLAIGIITLVLIGALKSFKYGMIGLFANLFPPVLAFGVWGALVGQIGMSAALVAAISLGIVVDDTVHFLSKYIRFRRERGLTPEEAIPIVFHEVGTAMLVTSIILIAGFFVLNFSGFLVNAQMGLLTGLAIVFALIVDFLFLPPLLIRLDSKHLVSKTAKLSYENA
jgi:uncharacterized protein